MSAIDVTDTTFEEQVLKADLPVLVDVWAPWCGPCKMIGPVVKNLAKENDSKFKLVMANMEDFSKIAVDLYIKATPTLLIFKDGTEIARRSDAATKSEIAKWLDENL